MTTINDGGPAFPKQVPVYDDMGRIVGTKSVGGMSLREYFAAKALALSATELWISNDPETVSQRCYMYADAMIAERAKGKNDV